jgi:cell division initiation protein
MKIVPLDIIHKTFKRKISGYDPDEVSEFLGIVSDELEAVIIERNKLKEALREKELELLEYKDRERILKDTITTASQMSDRIKVDAEREARIILNEANQKGEMIIRDARDSLKNTYKEISDLKRIKLQFETQMKSMLDAYKSLIEKQDLYLPKVSSEREVLSKNDIHKIEMK